MENTKASNASVKVANQKKQEGIALRDSLDKTTVIKVVRQVMHSKYGKFVRKTKKYLVHDENGVCKEGDLVRIVETRPLSKRKCWKVDSILASSQI